MKQMAIVSCSMCPSAGRLEGKTLCARTLKYVVPDAIAPECPLADAGTPSEAEEDKARIAELEELLLSCFRQACLIGGSGRASSRGVRYAHNFISTYEDVQDYLIQRGLVDPADCEYPPEDRHG